MTWNPETLLLKQVLHSTWATNCSRPNQPAVYDSVVNHVERMQLNGSFCAGRLRAAGAFFELIFAEILMMLLQYSFEEQRPGVWRLKNPRGLCIAHHDVFFTCFQSPGRDRAVGEV